MTRSEAISTVRTLAAGLAPDLAGVSRLMERVSQHDQAEELRAALTECGCRLLLDSWSEERGRPRCDRP